MAVAIPVIASFAAAGSAVAAAGTLAAAMGTIGGFLTIAGAALTGIGALTGEKDLMKIGGLMSLGGGLAGMAGAGAGSAAGAGVEAGAESGIDAATSDAWASGAGKGMDTVANAGGEVATEAVSNAGADQAMQLANEAGGKGVTYAEALNTADAAAPATVDAGQSSIWDRAGDASQQAKLMEANVTTLPSDIGQGGVSTGSSVAQQVPTDAVSAGGQKLSGNAVDSLLQKAKDKFGNLSLDSIGQAAQKNKDLFSMGGQVLNSMYGADAQALDMQKSIMNRRLKNLNNPVALSLKGG